MQIKVLLTKIRSRCRLESREQDPAAFWEVQMQRAPAPASYTEIYTEGKMIMNIKLILAWGIVVTSLCWLIARLTISFEELAIVGAFLLYVVAALITVWAVVTIIDN